MVVRYNVGDNRQKFKPGREPENSKKSVRYSLSPTRYKQLFLICDQL